MKSTVKITPDHPAFPQPIPTITTGRKVALAVTDTFNWDLIDTGLVMWRFVGSPALFTSKDEAEAELRNWFPDEAPDVRYSRLYYSTVQGTVKSLSTFNNRLTDVLHDLSDNILRMAIEQCTTPQDKQPSIPTQSTDQQPPSPNKQSEPPEFEDVPY